MPKKQTYEIIEDGKIKSVPIGKPKSVTAERSRKFALVSYIEPKALIKFCRQTEWIQHFALCTHDRDLNEDGTPKQVHTHILLYLYDAKTATAIRKLFDRYSATYYRGSDTEPQNTLAEVCADVVSHYRYLLHLDDPQKVQYERIERIEDNSAYWQKLEATAGLTGTDRNKVLAILEDMQNGVSTKELVVRYGRDYAYHIRHYKEIFHDCLIEASEQKTEFANPLIKTIFDSSMYRPTEVRMFYNMLDFLAKELKESYDIELKFDAKGDKKSE